MKKLIVNILTAVVVVVIVLLVVAFIYIIVVYCNVSTTVAEFKKTNWGTPALKSKEWKDVLENNLYSHTYTKNHTHLFLIDDNGIPWYRFVNVSSPYDKNKSSSSSSSSTTFQNVWKPLFWNGIMTSVARRIVTDGTHVALQDDNGKIYTRPIIKEWKHKDGSYRWYDMIGIRNWWRDTSSFSIYPIHIVSRKKYTKTDCPFTLCNQGVWNDILARKTPFSKNVTLWISEGSVLKSSTGLLPFGFSKSTPIPNKLQNIEISSTGS